jgi:hypothetical protein
MLADPDDGCRAAGGTSLAVTPTRKEPSMERFSPSPRRGAVPHASIFVDMPSFGQCNPRDIWEAWTLAQADVERAYREWAEAPHGERGEPYVRYRAALDREERAAVVLCATVGALDLAA